MVGWQKRWMAARMLSADLVQRKGLGSALWASMKALMSRSRAWVERWIPRLICFSVIRAKKRSTWLIQDASVGVKGRASGALGQPVADGLSFVGGVVVHDQVDVKVSRDIGLDLVEDLPELAGAVFRVAAADHCAGRHVQRGEQRRGAVADVVVRPPLRVAGHHRQQRLGAVERLDL